LTCESRRTTISSQTEAEHQHEVFYDCRQTIPSPGRAAGDFGHGCHRLRRPRGERLQPADSRQKGYLDRYVGSEYSMAFLPKVEISVWVSDAKAEQVADKIVRTARTGRIGDGKVFVLDMGWPEPLEF
jgi:hypothetical protein